MVCLDLLKVQVNAKSVANCYIPKCAAYEYGRECFRNTMVSPNKSVPEKQQEINNKVFLGRTISTYHYQSVVPGRLYIYRGSIDAKYMIYVWFFNY